MKLLQEKAAWGLAPLLPDHQKPVRNENETESHCPTWYSDAIQRHGLFDVFDPSLWDPNADNRTDDSAEEEPSSLSVDGPSRCYRFLEIMQPRSRSPSPRTAKSMAELDLRVKEILSKDYLSLSRDQILKGRLMCAYISWNIQRVLHLLMCPLCGFPFVHLSNNGKLQHIKKCSVETQFKYGYPENHFLMKHLLYTFYKEDWILPNFIEQWATSFRKNNGEMRIFKDFAFIEWWEPLHRHAMELKIIHPANLVRTPGTKARLELEAAQRAERDGQCMGRQAPSRKRRREPVQTPPSASSSEDEFIDDELRPGPSEITEMPDLSQMLTKPVKDMRPGELEGILTTFEKNMQRMFDSMPAENAVVRK